MKKSLSLLAMLTVLTASVLFTVGCGAKPAKGSVWQLTKSGSVSFPTKTTVGTNTIETNQLWCFHSDGNVYIKTTVKGNPIAAQNISATVKIGPYKISGKKISINNGNKVPFTLKNNVLTFKDKGAIVELKKTTDKEFKN